jgi:hypothetical protein
MFLKFRSWLIDKLAGEDIAVIINSKVYDYVIEANSKDGLYFIHNKNKVVSLESAIQAEVAQRINLDKQGVIKQGRAFVLK